MGPEDSLAWKPRGFPFLSLQLIRALLVFVTKGEKSNTALPCSCSPAQAASTGLPDDGLVLPPAAGTRSFLSNTPAKPPKSLKPSPPRRKRSFRTLPSSRRSPPCPALPSYQAPFVTGPTSSRPSSSRTPWTPFALSSNRTASSFQNTPAGSNLL